MNNLALIFSTIDISNNFFSKRNRRKGYKTSINSIIRWLPDSTEVRLVDNSGFFSLKGNKDFFQGNIQFSNIISLEDNLGKVNKGLGEMAMLSKANDTIDFLKFDRVFFFTGRHFVTNPYLFEKIISCDFDIAVSKPNFFQLDGTHEADGDLFSYNDMFFAMKPAHLISYIRYFESQKKRMVEVELGSEQLLFEFVEKSRVELPNLSIYVAPALGLLRFSQNIFGRLERLEVL